MAVNGTIHETIFTSVSKYPKKINIEEIQKALDSLELYKTNVQNCNCAPSNCCQMEKCQTITCQSCQLYECQSCQETSCQSFEGSSCQTPTPDSPSQPTFAYRIFTSDGIFTPTSGTTKVRVTVIGGGGGGVYGIHDSSENYDATYKLTGNTGGTSSAFGVIARGGAGGYCAYLDTSTDSDQSNYKQFAENGTGETNIVSLLDGLTYGEGRGNSSECYTDSSTSMWEQAKGGNGYTTVQIVSVNPGQNYSIVVGNGGKGYSKNRNNNIVTAFTGLSGAVQIEWGTEVI